MPGRMGAIPMRFKALFSPESGSNLELDRPPMSNSRFRVICALIAAALFVALVLGVTALAGLPGLVVTAFATAFISAIFAVGV